MTSSDLRNHFLGIRSQQMKIQRLDSSEAEIMLRGRKWKRTGLTCCPV
ncbi:hypothetical protein T05_2933 [Trichinella murrelli]|uniref:Uncharacterized protein n=1 Tax=Trichinella murrelli TaxID=144512 RepID=A0A0V0SY62_9BILA|nr:hypothetical protein T05_2933 [Trichinella murrelli]